MLTHHQQHWTGKEILLTNVDPSSTALDWKVIHEAMCIIREALDVVHS